MIIFLRNRTRSEEIFYISLAAVRAFAYVVVVIVVDEKFAISATTAATAHYVRNRFALGAVFGVISKFQDDLLSKASRFVREHLRGIQDHADTDWRPSPNREDPEVSRSERSLEVHDADDAVCVSFVKVISRRARESRERLTRSFFFFFSSFAQILLHKVFFRSNPRL